MSPTISDIAKSVGVTKSTVSAVLSNSKSNIRISAGTRDRIMTAAREMNWRPSFSARALARGRTFSIGMICGDIHSPHFSELASQAMREAERHGYHLLLSVMQWLTTKNNLDCLETLMNRGVDGILAWGSGLKTGTPLYDDIIRKRFPIVICSEDLPGLSSIDLEWDSGMNETLAYLKNKGHSRVCFVGYTDKSGVQGPNPKREAFFRACSRHGIQGSDACLTKLSDLEEAEELGMKIAEQAGRASAYLVYSDYVAFGFCRGLINRGLRIPEDVAVVGIDGTQMGKCFHPALTSMAQDREQFVRRAIDMVVGLIDKKEDPGRKVLLPTKLIIRESA